MRWTEDITEARKIQENLKKKVRIIPLKGYPLYRIPEPLRMADFISKKIRRAF